MHRPHGSTTRRMRAASDQLPSRTRICNRPDSTIAGGNSPPGCRIQRVRSLRTNASALSGVPSPWTCKREPDITRWMSRPVLVGRRYSRRCMRTSTGTGQSTARRPLQTHQRVGRRHFPQRTAPRSTTLRLTNDWILPDQRALRKPDDARSPRQRPGVVGSGMVDRSRGRFPALAQEWHCDFLSDPLSSSPVRQPVRPHTAASQIPKLPRPDTP